MNTQRFFLFIKGFVMVVLVGDANLVYHLGKHHNNAIWLSSLSALAFFHVSSTHRSCFIIRLCVNIPFRVGIRPYVHTCCYVNFPVATRVEYDTLKIGISFVTRLFTTPRNSGYGKWGKFLQKEKKSDSSIVISDASNFFSFWFLHCLSKFRIPCI